MRSKIAPSTKKPKRSAIATKILMAILLGRGFVIVIVVDSRLNQCILSKFGLNFFILKIEVTQVPYR